MDSRPILEALARIAALCDTALPLDDKTYTLGVLARRALEARAGTQAITPVHPAQAAHWSIALWRELVPVKNAADVVWEACHPRLLKEPRDILRRALEELQVQARARRTPCPRGPEL